MMALNAEPSTRRWLPSHVYESLAEAKTRMAFLIAQCESPGTQAWPVCDRRRPGQCALIGHVGFSALDDDVEVSYAIAEAHRGRGYGSGRSRSLPMGRRDFRAGSNHRHHGLGHAASRSTLGARASSTNATKRCASRRRYARQRYAWSPLRSIHDGCVIAGLARRRCSASIPSAKTRRQDPVSRGWKSMRKPSGRGEMPPRSPRTYTGRRRDGALGSTSRPSLGAEELFPQGARSRPGAPRRSAHEAPPRCRCRCSSARRFEVAGEDRGLLSARRAATRASMTRCVHGEACIPKFRAGHRIAVGHGRRRRSASRRRRTRDNAHGVEVVLRQAGAQSTASPLRVRIRDGDRDGATLVRGPNDR
jgi:hypothetical protein